MTKIFIGTFPSGYGHTAIPEGAVEAAVKAANAALDLEQEPQRRQAKIRRSDLLRLENPKRARMTRRFKPALAALGSRTRR
jgi:hypothetical protein